MEVIHNYNEVSNLRGIISGIYKITYLPLNKSYVGKSTDIYKRWRQHLYRDNKSNKDFHYLLWEEPQNFSFSILEECDVSIIDEREKHWIAFYDTKNNGFNLTTGGECGTHYDYDEIVNIYKQNGYNAVLTSKIVGCNRETVIKAISVKNVRKPLKKVIKCLDKKGNLIRIFNSIAEASNIMGIDGSSISAVCRKKRKSAGGFIWVYQEEGEE